MKSIASKKMFLTTMLISSSGIMWAAGTGNEMQIGDPMIFSLLVILAVVFLVIIFSQVSALKGILNNKELWMSKKKDTNSGAKEAGAIILALLLGQGLFAQSGTTAPAEMSNALFWILIVVNALLLGIIIVLNFTIKGLINSANGEEDETISQLTASLTGAIPIERESEILLDHDYDGIHELDNNLPPWWKYGFYLTIVFAFVYLIYYHVAGAGALQIEEYNNEMAAAEIELEAYNATRVSEFDESNLVALTDNDRLEAGKEIFMGNCMVCHGAFGEGLIGPNFTDKYWIHGGGIENIYNTIKVGVPEKGMIPWESMLTSEQRLEVSSYILSLEGTDPPNQKAPEGDLWEGKSSPTPPAETDSTQQEELVVEEATEEKG